MSQTTVPAVPRPRWPGVLGMIGIVLGVLTLIDKFSDLVVFLTWSERDWRRIIPPEAADFALEAIPPVGWVVLTSLIWMALSGILLKGSVALRGRRRSGIRLFRLWSKLVISWFMFELVVELWWVARFGDQIMELAPGDWLGTAFLGILLVVAVILAFPVFVLVWFSRPPVVEEYADWLE